MAKGIIYVMTTVVPGLLKIGKTGSENFESRMYTLERNGYSNVTGLKRRFAIEVEDYDEKEQLLNEMFSKSKVPNTELFALDIDMVIKLLSSFEGTKIYPPEMTKEEVFDEAVREAEEKKDTACIPDGLYYLERKIKNFGPVKGHALVRNGIFTVLKGSTCAPAKGPQYVQMREGARIENHILMDDIVCTSPSTAGSIIIGGSNNGWDQWKDKDGNKIDVFREKK